jgi:hypothetical protein
MFDFLEDIVKARKAKGLAEWRKFETVQELLAGKQLSDITFTTCYPGQEGAKKHLGSATGNLHFVLGYVSPAFHLAPYHWRIVDPNITDEEAAKKGHPANPRYWQLSGLPLEDEGDFEVGKPHKSAATSATSDARRMSRKTEAMTVKSGYANYVVVPSQREVYSMVTGHVYKWDLIKESFFAATNPEVAEVMNADDNEIQKSFAEAIGFSDPLQVQEFDTRVYPLVKDIFPLPGSVIPLGKSLYGVVTPSSIVFVKSSIRGAQVESIQLLDRTVYEIDLLQKGDTFPAIVLNFGSEYLGIDFSSLIDLVRED